jgi:hypothetical protein
MHNSGGSVMRTCKRKKILKIAAKLNEVPRVSLPAKTIYGLLKKFRKTCLLLKEHHVRTRRFFCLFEEVFMIQECVQNHGHEMPLDDYKTKPAFQSHRTSSQKST